MITIWTYALPPLLLIGSLAWVRAARLRNVNIVDSLWSLFFLIASSVYLTMGGQITTSSLLLFGLIASWALRLSLHLTVRNAGKGEDRRYAAMRAANPKFNGQSLFTVFGLQAVLAWLISMPLAAALIEPAPLQMLHLVGIAVFLFGFFFEAAADWQLARFKADPRNKGRVLDSGLWRYSRHPNYFGEGVIWWGFYLFAVASGAAWTGFAPLLMTFLLLKVSGVTLLEKDIQDRRPDYRRYKQNTSAFIPWKPRDNELPAGQENHS
jgi:steroid 5-alpha reductase family enzyme